MAFNGSGTASVLYSFVTDRNDGIKIQAQRMDDQFEDIAEMLTLCLLKDGQQTPTADIPLGGFKLTNVGDPTNATDALNRQTGDARYHPIGATTTTDNALARYDGLVGALQNSGILIDDSNNLSAAASLATTGSGVTNQHSATSTDAGASDWSAYMLDRNSASPAANDVLGSFVFRGRDSGANATDYASIRGAILDHTDTSEDGQLLFRALVAGAATTLATLGPGLQLGAPTNGDKGAGTLNATGIYVNDDAAVTLVASQTLTNKTLGNTNTVTLKDTLFTLQDDGDATKQVRWQLSGLTTGNTRTITVLDADMTLVGLTNTQTLTNKTLTSPALTSPTITGGSTSSSTDTTTVSYTATSTEGGANTFVGLDLYRNSSTPAAVDFLSKIQWNGKDNAANKTAYAEIDVQIADTTDASEDANLIFRNVVGGTMTDALAIGQTAAVFASALQIKAPAGVISTSVSINDDSFTSLTPASNGGLLSIGISASPGATRPFGIVAVRPTAAASPVTVAWSDATNVAYSTATPNGTTGTDGKLTISCPGDGNVYVENRLGAQLTFHFTFIS